MSILRKTFLTKIQNFRLNETSFALLMIEINELKILSLLIKSTINDQIDWRKFVSNLMNWSKMLIIVTTQTLLNKKSWQYHVMKITKIKFLTQIYHCYQIDKDKWINENLLKLFELSDKQNKQINENLSELFRLSKQITYVYKHWTRRS